MDRAKYRIKNSVFEGVPVWVSWVSLVPKVYFGLKTMCKKFQEVPTLGCNLGRGNFHSGQQCGNSCDEQYILIVKIISSN